MFKKYWTMDKVQKLNNSNDHIVVLHYTKTLSYQNLHTVHISIAIPNFGPYIN